MADQHDRPASAAPRTEQEPDVALAPGIGARSPRSVEETLLNIDDYEGGDHAATLANHSEATSASIEAPVAAYATSSVAANASTRLTRPISLHAAPSRLR